MEELYRTLATLGLRLDEWSACIDGTVLPTYQINGQCLARFNAIADETPDVWQKALSEFGKAQLPPRPLNVFELPDRASLEQAKVC